MRAVHTMGVNEACYGRVGQYDEGTWPEGWEGLVHFLQGHPEIEEVHFIVPIQPDPENPSQVVHKEHHIVKRIEEGEEHLGWTRPGAEEPAMNFPASDDLEKNRLAVQAWRPEPA